MSTPFLAEIRTTAFQFAPVGWALCNGQLLAISQNQALFALVGTIYGGDGIHNFALPDLRGRVPLHAGLGIVVGEAGGLENVALTTAQLPAHQHSLLASADFANASVPGGAVPGAKPRGGTDIYAAPGGVSTTLSPGAIGSVGGGQAHDNLQPFLTLNFIIALEGIFPSRN